MTARNIRPLIYTWFIFKILFWYFFQPSLSQRKNERKFLGQNSLDWIINFLGTIVILWYIVVSIRVARRRVHSPLAQRLTVLVTGCDSGFGLAIAKRLHHFGFRVFATVLKENSQGAKELRQLNLTAGSNRAVCVVQLDVTVERDVDRVIEEIEQNNAEPLWAVVNNAGIGLFCPFEWGEDVDEYRRIFEVNVFGLVRVTKRCIGALRRSQGRVVNVSSLAGRISSPQLSHYCMSKSAVRSFTDAIRLESRNSRVKFVTIEPTLYRTSIIDQDTIANAQTRIYDRTPDRIKSFYHSGSRFLSPDLKLLHSRARENLNEIADAVLDAITHADPPSLILCCSAIEKIQLLIFAHLPEVVANAVIRYTYLRYLSKLR